MKIIVTGASGLLGWDVADTFEARGHTVRRLMGRRDVNVLEPQAVLDYILAERPDAVIHAAGYRDLDDMERNEWDSYAINTFATRNIALACRAADCKLLYVSSDTVFDGEKGTGYHEYDRPCPVNVYGKSKLAAEQVIQSLWPKHFILRTALLFGYKGHRENNFIFHITDQLRANKTISASMDQICCPSYTADLAAAMAEMVESQWYGVYHVANTGTGSRYEISRAVAEAAGLDPEMVQPVEAAQSKLARRAKNTVFRSIAWPATFHHELPDWHDAMERCMAEIKAAGLLEVER